MCEKSTRKIEVVESPVPEIYFQNASTGKWYWYDETFTKAYGPYDSYEEAQEACNKYCREVLGHD